MNADEVMIVVVLGDNDVKFSEEQNLTDIEIKQENLDDIERASLVEELLQTAEEHGEHLDPEYFNFIKKDKEEPSDDEDDSDEEFVPDVKSDPATETSTDDDDDFVVKLNKTSKPIKKQNKVKMLKLKECTPYVGKVRDENPHFDNNQLVAHLADVMKNTKPPSPPKDYYRDRDSSGMLECTVCSALSNTQQAAARHYQDKHGPRYLVCFACGASFRSTCNLYKHEKICRAQDSVLVLQARALSVERKGRNRPFVHLQHELLKEEKQKYICDECPAVFKVLSTLKSHMLLHRGERPFSCEKCGAAYTTHSGLAQHRQKHTDIHYICDTCGRDFKSKTAFAYHVDTHLPRKHVCPYEKCGRRYAQKGSLNIHVIRRHQGLPLPCACHICPRRFARMSLLKKHMMDKHGMTIMTKNMLYKQMPTLSNVEVKQAKIFFDEGKHHDTFKSPAPASEIRVITENIED